MSHNSLCEATKRPSRLQADKIWLRMKRKTIPKNGHRTEMRGLWGFIVMMQNIKTAKIHHHPGKRGTYWWGMQSSCGLRVRLTIESFKPWPGQKFAPPYQLSYVHCQWERTGRPPSNAEDRKMKLLTLYTHGCSRASSWYCFSSSTPTQHNDTLVWMLALKIPANQMVTMDVKQNPENGISVLEMKSDSTSSENEIRVYLFFIFVKEIT